MSRLPPPAGLEDLQNRFGGLIRTPLDRATGTLTATPAAYDPELRTDTGNTEGLATYNRQYWFRLFGVMQAAFPLTTRLLGAWTFNDLAARFLQEHPPQDWDIDAAPDGFDAFVAEALGAEALLVEAVGIDAAWRNVFRAPRVDPYRPTAEDAARLPSARLRLSPAVALVEEHWPLLALRAAPGRDGDAPLGPPHPQGRWWAILRQQGGIAALALDDREARLLGLLRTEAVGVALARLEQECAESERATLPERARRWLARCVSLGFWTGYEPVSEQTTQL